MPAGLVVSKLHKRFGHVVALHDLNLDVRPGELFGFVGSNGAGKSTAMRIVLGVTSTDSGTVCWNGAPIDDAVRARIGYMPEERGLYPNMRVGEQLAWMAELRGPTRSDATSAARGWTDRLGIQDRWSDAVETLSLGNQQRVQLAAALVHGPDLLVLDEPFSGLDPVAVDVMSEVLREQAERGVPVLFSSHQLDLVQRLCDRVGIIRAGCMVACDTVDALRDGNGMRQLEVQVDDAPAGWTDTVTSARVLQRDGDVTVLELDAGADDQAILHAAMAAGPVRRFARRRPTLTERYRDAVTVTDADADAGSHA